MIEANIIHASFLAKVEKLLFLGSSCITKHANQPMTESALLPAHWNQPDGMLLQNGGHKLCKPIASSMALISYRQCQQISMGRMTILTFKKAMSFRR